MSFHLKTAQERVRPPTDGVNYSCDNVNDGEAAVMQFNGQIRLWYIDSGDNAGWWYRYNNQNHPVGPQDHYDPPVRIRGMSIMATDSTGRLIDFDMPRSDHCIERFVFGLPLALWVTRVWLTDVLNGTGAGNQTTATQINLYY
ncbi:MAG: hypothetical protein U9Q07_06620 [Planctomycetota bacterium]|nr:hypothetical protein [Planctomycetota bacterium]